MELRDKVVAEADADACAWAGCENPWPSLRLCKTQARVAIFVGFSDHYTSFHSAVVALGLTR